MSRTTIDDVDVHARRGGDGDERRGERATEDGALPSSVMTSARSLGARRTGKAKPQRARLVVSLKTSTHLHETLTFAASGALSSPSPLFPGAAGAQVIDLTVNDVGLAIGDKPRMTGLRINFRDRNLEEIRGVNLTIWQPYQPATGTVNGLALGLPTTGAKTINGAMIGVLGGGTEKSFNGLGVGGIGIGSGGDASRHHARRRWRRVRAERSPGCRSEASVLVAAARCAEFRSAASASAAAAT